MTIITPTGITGINSITSSGNSLSFQNASGSSIDVSGLKVAADSMNVSGIVTASGIVVAAGNASAPSISPTGDSNTGIFFPSPDTIAFAEGGTESFRLDSSGNVNIANGNLVFSTSGKGIDFSATANSSGSMSSEILSDYTKIGRIVNLVCSFRGNSVPNNSSTAIIGGVPFTSSSSGVSIISYDRGFPNITKAIVASISSTSISFVVVPHNSSGGFRTALLNSDLTGFVNDFDIGFNLIYSV
jgi:hypothetical protein